METINTVKKQENTQVIEELNKKALLINNILNTNGYFVEVSLGRKINIDKIDEVRMDPRVDCFYVITQNGDREYGYKLVILNQWLAATPVKVSSIRSKFPKVKFTLIGKPRPIINNKPTNTTATKSKQVNTSKPKQHQNKKPHKNNNKFKKKQ